MSERPHAESLAAGRVPVSWVEAFRRVGETSTSWLATARPDERPHLVPVLAVWLAERPWFSASPDSRKARNLAKVEDCSIAVEAHGLDLVVEGRAVRITDEPALRRAADAYASVYDWRVTVRDGAFHDTEGAPTAGPPPYHVYEVRPISAFGFPTEEAVTPTRWRF